MTTKTPPTKSPDIPAKARKAKATPAAPALAETPVVERRTTPLSGGALQLSTHVFSTYSVTPAPSVVPGDLLDPTFWQNVASRLRPGDEIRVLASDFSWVENLLVVYAVGNAARVFRLGGATFDQHDMDEPDERFDVRRLTTGGFALVDTLDNSQIGPSCPTRSRAERAREDHLKALGL